jgi:hypothetical protein
LLLALTHSAKYFFLSNRLALYIQFVKTEHNISLSQILLILLVNYINFMKFVPVFIFAFVKSNYLIISIESIITWKICFVCSSEPIVFRFICQITFLDIIWVAIFKVNLCHCECELEVIIINGNTFIPSHSLTIFCVPAYVRICHVYNFNHLEYTEKEQKSYQQERTENSHTRVHSSSPFVCELRSWLSE